MATTIQDFVFSSEKTIFQGSSAEDVTRAKSFWQSIQLHPPIESRLVSSNIKQRLKIAPPGTQRNFFNYRPSTLDLNCNKVEY